MAFDRDQCHGRQRRADEEVRSAPAEARPGPIRVVAHEWLNEQSGDRARQPEQRDGLEIGTEILENARGVSLRQRESELDTKRTQADLADLPRGQDGLRIGGTHRLFL
jgi:hypothetical protein